VGPPLGIRGGGKGKEKTFNLFPKPNVELKMVNRAVLIDTLPNPEISA
jgi:hypothetical protein